MELESNTTAHSVNNQSVKENMHEPLILNDSISREESYRLIDEAIAHAQHPASILALKYQRNALAPISSLPPEVLRPIFSLVKREVPLQTYLPYFFEFQRQWIAALTHVTTYWRHVAINIPHLWVDLPFHSPGWVQEMLQRSKDADLEIDVNFFPSSTGMWAVGNRVNLYRNGLELALKHNTRIKHLAIRYIADASAWNDFQKALPKYAPNLESLCMTGCGGGNIVISEDVLCETERLRHLKLAEFSLNWSSHSSLLRSLTHLTLRGLFSKPTGKQFMDALKGMPKLEFLDMDTFPFDDAWGSNQIHLANLQMLSVSSPHTEIEAFFRHVTFPPTAKVTVHCAVDNASTFHAQEMDFTGVISSLSGSYSNPVYNTQFRTLICFPSPKFAHGISFGLFIDAMTQEQMIIDDKAEGPISYMKVFDMANLKISFACQEPPDFAAPLDQYIENIMTNVCSGFFPLQDVIMHVSLADAEGISVSAILDAFGVLPQIRSIFVDRSTSSAFLQALLSYVEELDGTIKRYSFPNLSWIYFVGTKFIPSDRPEVLRNRTSIPVNSLKDCLLRRSQSGAKIDKVIFRHCHNLRECDVESLSQLIGEIDWDQRETDSDAEDEYDEDRDGFYLPSYF